MQDFAVHQSDMLPADNFGRQHVRVCVFDAGAILPAAARKNF